MRYKIKEDVVSIKNYEKSSAFTKGTPASESEESMQALSASRDPYGNVLHKPQREKSLWSAVQKNKLYKVKFSFVEPGLADNIFCYLPVILPNWSGNF